MAGPVVIEFHSVPFLKSSTFRLSVGSLRLSFAHLFVLKITSCHFVDLTRYQQSVTGHVGKQVDGLVLFGTQPSSHVKVSHPIRAELGLRVCVCPNKSVTD